MNNLRDLIPQLFSIFKISLFLFLIGIFSFTLRIPISHALTYGPYNPGTVVNTSSGDPAGSTVNWTSVVNAKTSDNNYAVVNLSSDSSYSVYMKASNFNFNIPSGSSIQGITVSIERKADYNNYVSDKYVQIIKSDGSIGTVNNANTLTQWDSNDEIVTYGGTSNLWGETWTYSDINDTDFGVALSVREVGSSLNREAMVDSFTITVSYTAPNTPTPIPTNTTTPIPTKTPVPAKKPTPVPTSIPTSTPVPIITETLTPDILEGISTTQPVKLPLFDVVTTPVQSNLLNIIPILVVFLIIVFILILLLIITWRRNHVKLENLESPQV